jgi:hypothetical protein
LAAALGAPLDAALAVFDETFPCESSGLAPHADVASETAATNRVSFATREERSAAMDRITWTSVVFGGGC